MSSSSRTRSTASHSVDRNNAVDELIAAETTYFSELQLLRELYIEPLSQSELQLQALFGRLNAITNRSATLLSTLKSDEKHDKIGETMLEFVSFLETYQTYAENLKLSTETLASLLAHNTEFRLFHDKQHKVERAHGQSLQFFLELPVQRMSSYEESLKIINLLTKPDHPDLSRIYESFDKVSAANKAIKKALNNSVDDDTDDVKMAHRRGRASRRKQTHSQPQVDVQQNVQQRSGAHSNRCSPEPSAMSEIPSPNCSPDPSPVAAPSEDDNEADADELKMDRTASALATLSVSPAHEPSPPSLVRDGRADPDGASPAKQWKCAKCTLLNDEEAMRCSVCNTRRPRHVALFNKITPATSAVFSYDIGTHVPQRARKALRCSTSSHHNVPQRARKALPSPDCSPEPSPKPSPAADSTRSADRARKAHQCTECDKSFRKPSDLEQHMRVHSGEKPYQCTLCDKTFTQKGSRKRHMRLHEGEKQHKCAECGSAFARKAGLKSHMRIHTGEKPYQCKVCSKSFGRASARDMHMRIHTGFRPHVCTVCRKTFIQKSHLDSHSLKHDQAKPWQCKHCLGALSAGAWHRCPVTNETTRYSY